MSSKPTADKIRRDFLEFFAERGHREVPSGPVFPQDDPTLLFTNAGMNQFKDVFLGAGKRDYTRATDTQKCIRVSGKHNDLEEVGVDTYHHTFFEMMGNWSFGDYFKPEAITWAWELLTKVWGLPKERLWVTVFVGDEKDGLPADKEAESLWLETTDVLPDHVLRFSRADNFWEMGETGPCGPCSEIHIDRGGADADPRDGADPKIGVNAGNERFIELWNLVFMEFNRLDDGSLRPLPARHVDTGMGFERIVSVLQEKSSNYDTDVFTPIFQQVAEVTGRTYSAGTSASDVAFRVIADHLRAVTSAFSDGALPSNVGRGYVLRRLIRRASRYGRQRLDMEDPFLWRLVPAVVETLGGVFPEMRERAEHVQLLVRTEEEAFGKTLGRGLVRFEELAQRVEKHAQRAEGLVALPGADAFELYATYGFPRDLVELMARERELVLDEAGWDDAQRAHQEKSRSEGRFQQVLSAEQLEGLPETRSTYHEEGEQAYAVETKALKLVAGDDAGRASALILAESPFYPEGGGQVADLGVVEEAEGRFRFEVTDVQRMGGVIVHLGRAEGIVPSDLTDGTGGLHVVARIDRTRRERTKKNHTATHLLHRALKDVLGEHVNQQGSYVGPDRLRFDMSHPKALSAQEVEQVEALVNGQVFRNQAVVSTVEDLDAAKARGVMALFGEKYQDRVRVVDVPEFSIELCGGTHVSASGDIGPFVITLETAIQAGVRRIEALTGPAAVEWIQAQRRILRDIGQTLKASPEELSERVMQLQERVKEAKKKAKKSASADVDTTFDQVKDALRERDGILSGVASVNLSREGVRELSSRVKSLSPDLAVLLLGEEGGRVPWVAICQGKARKEGLDAGCVVQHLAAHVGGGGGGKPELAQGQGQKAQGRQALLEAFGEEPEGLFR